MINCSNLRGNTTQFNDGLVQIAHQVIWVERNDALYVNQHSLGFVLTVHKTNKTVANLCYKERVKRATIQRCFKKVNNFSEVVIVGPGISQRRLAPLVTGQIHMSCVNAHYLKC